MLFFNLQCRIKRYPRDKYLSIIKQSDFVSFKVVKENLSNETEGNEFCSQWENVNKSVTDECNE